MFYPSYSFEYFINKENIINPVFYLQKGSHPTKLLSEYFENIKYDPRKNAIQTISYKQVPAYWNLTSFYKPREGKIWDKQIGEFKKKNNSKEVIKNFYNEREWRYVPVEEPPKNPEKININFRPVFIYQQAGKFNYQQLATDNERLKTQGLSFNASDIKYLIVSKEKTINTLSKFISRLVNYEDYEINELKSKIISLEQIKSDF